MLELRCHCEYCGKDLPPEAVDAMICSFECTFCAQCASGPLHGMCPNCGGTFAPRPIRPTRLLERYPPSTIRRPLVRGAKN